MHLEEIRDILRLIRPYHRIEDHSLDVENLYSEDSKFGEFFRNIVDTPMQKDEEMGEKIYGEIHPGSKYMKLKSSFASRALNSLLFLDLQKPDISDSTRAFYACNKNLFFISILLRSGRRKAAIPLVKKTLDIAVKYELHGISAAMYDNLRTHSMLEGTKKIYDKYLRGMERSLELLESESNMRTLDHRLRIHSSRSSYVDEGLEQGAGEAVKICKSELVRSDTFENRCTYYRMQYMYWQYAGSPSKSLGACEEAFDYFKTKPHLATQQIKGEYELYKIENYLLSRNYEKAKNSIVECDDYFRMGSNQWFKNKEVEFLLLMQTLHFDKAYEVFRECTMHPRFGSQPGHIAERWKIFQLYLDYIEYKKKGTVSKLFRLKKYRQILKEYPRHSGDKRGFNIALLTMNILLLVENERYTEVDERAEALATYRLRHLNRNNARESTVFFKLIQLMVKEEFDYEIIKRKSIRLEKILAKTKPSLGELKEYVQIIPPQWMWARMKEALGKNWKKKKRKKKVSYIGSRSDRHLFKLKAKTSKRKGGGAIKLKAKSLKLKRGENGFIF